MHLCWNFKTGGCEEYDRENVPHAWSDVLRAIWSIIKSQRKSMSQASSSHRESECLIFKLKTVDNGC